MKVVSDSSPLIALSKINKLHILKDMFNEVLIPKSVWIEVVEKGKGKYGSEEVKNAKWIKVVDVKDRLSVEIINKEI